jgi:glycosyltransferase involved in cell wall biosynthesis
VYTAKDNQSTSLISYNSHEHKLGLKEKLPFSAIYSISGVQVVEIDFRLTYNVEETLFHSYLADILRIKKLEEHGGIWFDMDILFLQPFSDELCTFQKGKSVKTISYSDTVATGFTVALPQSQFLKELSETTSKYLRERKETNFDSEADYKDQYQAFGPDLWRKLAHPYLNNNLGSHPHITALNVDLVYPYLWDQMNDYFLGKNRTTISQKTIGVHWYNGSTEARIFLNEYLHSIDFENLRRTASSPIEINFVHLLNLKVDLSVPVISDFTTQLRGCNLQGVNLQNANLENADLRDANLQNANLQNANLKNSDLRGANLTYANLLGANLTNALLDGLAPPGAVVEINRVPTTNMLGISVVMAAFNRKDQLLKTLESIDKSKHPNFEVIIVDDASDEDQAVESFIEKSKYSFEIKIITITKQEKTWVNPSVAYNIGIRYATKEIILLQNAEVAHVGDVLTFTAKNIQPKDWLTFNCYGLNKQSTDNLYKGQFLKYEDVLKLNQVIGGNSVARDDTQGWLNHFQRHFVAYHYCGAIHREDLFRDMGGGFHTDFGNLIGGDDDYFVKRLIHLGYKFKVPNFTQNNPFVIHLHHEKSEQVKRWSKAEHEKAKHTLYKHFLSWGFAPEIDICLAPKLEIPMARRVLL